MYKFLCLKQILNKANEKAALFSKNAEAIRLQMQIKSEDKDMVTILKTRFLIVLYLKT